MLGLTELGRRSTGTAARLNQFCCVERLAALVALIASGNSETAVGTRALDVAVGKKALVFGAIRLRRAGFLKIALAQQIEENIMRHLNVVGSARGGIQVPGNAQF